MENQDTVYCLRGSSLRGCHELEKGSEEAQKRRKADYALVRDKEGQRKLTHGVSTRTYHRITKRSRYATKVHDSDTFELAWLPVGAQLPTLCPRRVH